MTTLHIKCKILELMSASNLVGNVLPVSDV